MVIGSKEQFDRLEAEWRERLSGRSLVFEADADGDIALEALEILSTNAEGQAPSQRARLLLRYRAVLCVGLCSVAALHYESGALWNNVPRGLRADPERQRETGRAFQQALKALALSRFTTPHKYVGEILMHSGVPRVSIDTLVRTLVRWDIGFSAGGASDFIQWVSRMPQAIATRRGLDVPTYRFLTQGGDVASDFVERILSVIDSGGTPVDLPRAIATEVVATLDKLSDRKGRRRRRSAANAPGLFFDAQHGLGVRLPALEAEIEADIIWTILVDGESHHVHAEAPWPGDPIEHRWVSLKSPTPVVTVMVEPGDQQWELTAIQPENPLIVFDGTTGALIPEKASLPKGIVWLAFPGATPESAEELLEYEGDGLPILETINALHGWEGWVFLSVDAASAKKLRLAGSERPWRYVTNTERPRFFCTGGLLPYVTTEDGNGVHSQRPRLILPGPRIETGHVDWTVTVTGEGGEPAMPRHTHRVSGSSAEIDIWEADEAVLGEYTVAVRGPLGRGAILRVAIAENYGLSSSAERRWMLDSAEGLEPAVLSVRDLSGSDQQVVAFGKHDRSKTIRLARSHQRLKLVAEVPHFAVSDALDGEAGEQVIPLVLDTEALATTTLRVRVPETEPRAKVVAVSAGEVLQTVEGKARRGSASWSFDLAVLSDTLRYHPSAELRVVWGGRSAPIAFLRPRRLASMLYVTRLGDLMLLARADVKGLVAFIYPRFAPWKQPTRIVIPDGASEVALPPEIRHEGKAFVTLAVENPWVPTVPPEQPEVGGDNTFEVEVGELVDVRDPRERGFRPWLAGLTSVCPARAESLPIVLSLYAWLKNSDDPERANEMRSQLAGAVREHRKRLLRAILSNDSDIDDLMRLLVEADVVTVPREEWESLEGLWTLAPGLGVLADTDELDGDNSAQFRAHLETSIGNEALSILDEGVDPAASIGRFSEQTNALLKMPEEQLERVILGLGIAPKTFLGADARQAASFQLLRHRNTPALRRVLALSKEILEYSTQAIHHDFGVRALEPVRARKVESKTGLGNLPTLSISLALLSRAAARGKPQCAKVYSYVREGYAQLAAAAPKFVHQDLALAELWITRWEDIEP